MRSGIDRQSYIEQMTERVHKDLYKAVNLIHFKEGNININY